MMRKPMRWELTHDLSMFKGLSLEHLVELMKCYLSKPVEFLEGRVGLCFHPASGRILLMDAHCRIAMMDNGVLKQWATCEVCWAEGFIDSASPKFVSDSLCSLCPPPEEKQF